MITKIRNFKFNQNHSGGGSFEIDGKYAGFSLSSGTVAAIRRDIITMEERTMNMLVKEMDLLHNLTHTEKLLFSGLIKITFKA